MHVFCSPQPFLLSYFDSHSILRQREFSQQPGHCISILQPPKVFPKPCVLFGSSSGAYHCRDFTDNAKNCHLLIHYFDENKLIRNTCIYVSRLFVCLNYIWHQRNQPVTNFSIPKIHGITHIIKGDLPLSLKAPALAKNPPWERY